MAFHVYCQLDWVENCLGASVMYTFVCVWGGVVCETEWRGGDSPWEPFQGRSFWTFPFSEGWARCLWASCSYPQPSLPCWRDLFQPQPRINSLFLRLSHWYCIMGKGRARKAENHRLTGNQAEKKQELEPYGLKSQVGTRIMPEKEPGVSAKTFALP